MFDQPDANVNAYKSMMPGGNGAAKLLAFVFAIGAIIQFSDCSGGKEPKQQPQAKVAQKFRP